MSNQDQLHRYLFENMSVRGELVNVSHTFQRAIENHDYPTPVKTLLGELLIATSLLTATLKFEGDITVQLQGDGPLKLVVVNGNNTQEMRGIARVHGDINDDMDLHQMIGQGVMVITITPEKGERYQGIVALEGETLAECLETYFRQSEQLATRLFLRVGEHDGQSMAAGMLLQVLPSEEDTSEEFSHLSQLTATIKNEELFTLAAQEVLYRLYNQEEVTLYPAQDVNFKCGCSRQRCADTLVTLPVDEVSALLEQDGKIDMHCDYCGADYIFTPEDISDLDPAKQH